MNTAEEFINDKISERKLAGNYRELKTENGLADFCSNDYLGFARSSALKKTVENEVTRHPQSKNGATGSRLLSGNLAYAEDLEKEIAAWHGYDAGLIFNSGYDANVGLFSSLLQKGDTVISDELIHASIIDGVRLSHANRYTFRHNDPESLEEKLKHAKGTIYIAVESVYSMDGDTPPLKKIIELAKKYDANVIVDEAHAIGLHPRGLVWDLQLQQDVFASVITFGKALGCHGAIVLGSQSLRVYLINFARSFIYTTASTFHALASINMAYQQLPLATRELALLKENIILFKKNINVNELLIKSDSSIQCIKVGDSNLVRKIALSLQQNGLDVRPILSPTVAKGTERLRICLHSFNTIEEITLLTNTINVLMNA